MLNDALSLVFPVLCAACSDGIHKGETHICTKCLYELPKANYHVQADNPVARLLWGRVQVNQAAAYYLFTKGGKVQQLIHQFKYKGQKEVGVTVGKQFAHDLLKVDWLKTIDVIIPVPLHATKLKKRGYNQSDYFAMGLSEISGIPMLTNVLARESESATQTRKSRYLRWKNVAQIFKVKDVESIEGKSVLLVDDVVTTGSTLDACAQRILELPGTSVSVATIAHAAAM